MTGRLKICVYGAGAIGGSIAVRLSRGDAEVSVIARGAQARAIQQSGLILLSGQQRFSAQPLCVDTPSALPPQDIVIVAVKDTQLAAIAEPLAGLLRPDTRVVFAINGIPWWFGDAMPQAMPAALTERLDPGGRLRHLAGMSVVAWAVVHSSNHVVEPGVILNTTPQRNKLVIGKPDNGTDPVIDTLLGLLRGGGYEAVAATDIRAEIWNKMLLFVGVSPVCALTGGNLRDMVNDPACHAVMSAVMREGLALGQRLGFDLPDRTEAWLDLYRDKPVRPSLLQDFESGREPELDNGILAFRTIALAQGFDVPIMSAIAALIGMKRQCAIKTWHKT